MKVAAVHSRRFPDIYADIGGSLVKAVLVIPANCAMLNGEDMTHFYEGLSIAKFGDAYLPNLTIASRTIASTILFYLFPVTASLTRFLEFVQAALPQEALAGSSLHFTGGGALKYANLLKSKTKAKTLEQHDELQTIVHGLELLSMLQLKDQVQELTNDGWSPYTGTLDHLILVQAGSGISILEITSGKASRIDGCALGGATFMGLSQCIVGADASFDTLVATASTTSPSCADLLVGDICSTETYLGMLDADVPAAYGGKMQSASCDNNAKIASIYQFVVINLVHIATLNARLAGITTIMFAGSFVGNIAAVSEYYRKALVWYGKGVIRGLFVRHHSFLGVLGVSALLHGWECKNITFP